MLASLLAYLACIGVGCLTGVCAVGMTAGGRIGELSRRVGHLDTLVHEQRDMIERLAGVLRDIVRLSGNGGAGTNPAAELARKALSD